MLTPGDRAELHKKLMRRWVWKIPLIVGLVWFAVWWQEKQEAQRTASNEAARVSAQNAAVFAGHWRGEIIYPWGAKYGEEFFFQPEGATVFGTASYRGAKREIEDVQLAGATLKFKLRYEEPADGSTRMAWRGYEARRMGDEVHLKVFDDRGNALVEARLTSVKAAEIVR